MLNKDTTEQKPWILLFCFYKAQPALFYFMLVRKEKKNQNTILLVSRQAVTCGERTPNISHIPPPRAPFPPFPSTVLLCLRSSLSLLSPVCLRCFNSFSLFLSHHSSVSQKNSGPLSCIYAQLALYGEGLLLWFRTTWPGCMKSIWQCGALRW